MMKAVLLLATGVFLFVAGSAFTLNKSNNRVNKESSVSPEAASVEAERALERLTSSIYESAMLADCGLSYEVFKYAMTGLVRLKSEGRIANDDLLTIIDFSKPSRAKRFYTIDLKHRKLLYRTYVSHGKNTGADRAVAFSNTINSNQSSLGFYLTGETYHGSKGFSLRLDGMEEGVNDNMRERAVVIHEAEYVSERWIKRYGRLGRSFGCPALPTELSADIINDIKGRTVIFAYFNDHAYLSQSPYLQTLDDKVISVLASLREL